MPSVGIAELIVLMIIILINLAIPTATLVSVLLIYRKVKHIEQALTQRDQGPGPRLTT